MYRLPQYLRDKVNKAIQTAKYKSQGSIYDDWELEVRGAGSMDVNAIRYYGKDLDDALDQIPNTFSHTMDDGVDIVELRVKALELNDWGDIVDYFEVDYINFFRNP